MQHPGGSEILSIDQLSQFRFSKPDDLRRLEREQQELSWALDGRSQYDGERLFGDQLPERLQGGTAPDQDHIRQLMAKNKATLEASRPPTDISPLQKSKYAALERDLRADIQEGMLSTGMTNDPTEYNVDMELAWQHYKAKKAIAWMNVRQLLDPTNDSPFFTSIEALRPTTAPTVDLRKLRMNWDHIAFTDAQERAAIELDDSIYIQFLRLKALDWSDKGIMRSLGLSRAGLEVAMAKLLAERLAQAEPEPEDDDEEGETPATPEAPEPLEVDEEDEAEEEDAALTVTARTGARAVPVALLPPVNNKSPAAKAAWLRSQLERRHIALAVLGRALGLEKGPLSTFKVKVSKGLALKDAEWQAIGLILARVDAQPDFLAPYTNEQSWNMSRKHTKEHPRSRIYAE